MEQISSFITKEKYQVNPSGTLFDPDWKLAKQGHCPYCFRKLYSMLKRPMMYCKNNKHKKFVVSKNKI